MKKLIFISIFSILSLRTLAQEVNIDEYKTYKPCTECSTEQWQKSRSTGLNRSTNSTSSHSTTSSIGNDLKNGTRKVVVYCVAIVGTLAGVIIYQKLNNEINNIN